MMNAKSLMCRWCLIVLFVLLFTPLLGTTAVHANGVIKIGIPEKLTGPYASDGKTAVDAMKLAVEEINADGGVLGKTLAIELFDIEDMTAEKIISAAEELIVRKKVDMLISGYAGMGPDVEHFGKYDIPYFHVNSVSSCIDLVKADPNKWNVFTVGNVDVGYGRTTFDGLARFPYDFPNKKIAFIFADWEWERLYKDGIKKRAQEKGWQVVMEEVFPYATTEWNSVLMKVRAAKPAIICVESLYMDDSVTFFRQFLKQPTNSLLYFGYAVGVPGYPELVGKEGDGLLGMGGVSFMRNVEGRAWADRFQKRYGYEPPRTLSSQVYDGIKMWAEAVKAVGNEKDYRAVCKYIEDNPYHGISGIYKYEAGHSLAEGPDFPMPFIQIQKGTIKDVFWHQTKNPDVDYMKPKWMK
jgi:ABC-type branched-subunit amino acid transport system substrate-binding protein